MTVGPPVVYHHNASVLQIEANQWVYPVSKCPRRCSRRGTCIKKGKAPPTCVCWQGYAGAACEQVRAKTRSRLQGSACCWAYVCSVK